MGHVPSRREVFSTLDRELGGKNAADLITVEAPMASAGGDAATLSMTNVVTTAESVSRLRAWPTGLRVVPRGREDTEGLWRLFNQASFHRSAAISVPFESPAAVQAWFDGNGLGNYEMVGTMDGEVVSFGGLYPLRGRQSHIGWITLCVHERYQSLGIGTVLLNLALALADRLAGLLRVQLNVLTENVRAIALYRAFGFRTEGYHEAFLFRDGIYVNALTMARVIR